jgi:hypothetical protein
MPETNDILRRLHEVYHAPPDADLHLSPHGYRSPQPGTADFSAERLVGSAAPESYIERWDATGPEDFGPVEILDGRTGRHIAKINSANRRRMS